VPMGNLRFLEISASWTAGGVSEWHMDGRILLLEVSMVLGPAAVRLRRFSDEHRQPPVFSPALDFHKIFASTNSRLNGSTTAPSGRG
jgi:hypothetical protein